MLLPPPSAYSCLASFTCYRSTSSCLHVSAIIKRRQGCTHPPAVAARQLAVLDRIARLEAGCGLAAAAAVAAPAPPAAAASPAALPLSAGAALLPEVKEVNHSGSDVQQRLQAELLEFGLTRHKFVWVGGKEARAWD